MTPLRYSNLYRDYGQFPEMGMFPRYNEEWPWMLDHEVDEIRQLREECEEDLNRSYTIPGSRPLNLLDWHPRPMGGNKRLAKKIKRLKILTRRYSRNLVLFHQVMQLPKPSSRHSNRSENLFEGGVFGPTGEAAWKYRDLDSATLCSVAEAPPEDLVTSLLLNFIPRIEDYKWSKYLGIPRKEDGEETLWSLDFRAVDKVVTYLAWVLGNLLLTAALFALDGVKSTRAGIAIIGVFGFLYSLLTLSTGCSRRIEMFAVIGGYYAIASVPSNNKQR